MPKYEVQRTDRGVAVLADGSLVGRFYGPHAMRNARAFAGLELLMDATATVSTMWQAPAGGVGTPEVGEAMAQLARSSEEYRSG